MEKKEPLCTVGGMQIAATTVESSMDLPQKIKNGTALWPSDSTSWNISEKIQNTTLKEYMYPYIHCSVIYNNQDLEAAQVPISRWVDKKAWYIYTMEYYWAKKKKKEGNITFWNSMDGPGECYVKWDKPVRERQVWYDFTYMWNLMNKTNKIETDS